MLKISSSSNLEPAVEHKLDCIQMSASNFEVTCCLSVLNRYYVFGVHGSLDYSGVNASSISSSSNDLHHHEAVGVLGGCFELQIQSQQIGDHQQKMLRHDLYWWHRPWGIQQLGTDCQWKTKRGLLEQQDCTSGDRVSNVWPFWRGQENVVMFQQV